jgi:hypothetical protein
MDDESDEAPWRKLRKREKSRQPAMAAAQVSVAADAPTVAELNRAGNSSQPATAMAASQPAVAAVAPTVAKLDRAGMMLPAFAEAAARFLAQIAMTDMVPKSSLPVPAFAPGVEPMPVPASVPVPGVVPAPELTVVPVPAIVPAFVPAVLPGAAPKSKYHERRNSSCVPPPLVPTELPEVPKKPLLPSESPDVPKELLVFAEPPAATVLPQLSAPASPACPKVIPAKHKPAEPKRIPPFFPAKACRLAPGQPLMPPPFKQPRMPPPANLLQTPK